MKLNFTLWQCVRNIAICILLCNYNCDGIMPVRNTLYGNVRGIITSRLPGKDVEEYLGVPYASASVRFQRPDDPTPWKPNVLNTTALPHACIQQSVTYIRVHKPYFKWYSEDCLYMNIYVPVVTKSSLPVLLYIHGGSNTMGMGAMFDGDILAAYGQIIVITFNYRLGALGFYADRDEGIEGNNGLLDQVKAMQWVQDNIKFFNGDKSRVTIYGHSAGAGNVGLHLLSNLSKGLFKNAVVHSGSPLAMWGFSPCVLTGWVNCIPSDCRDGSSRISNPPKYDDLMKRRVIHNFMGMQGEGLPDNDGLRTFLPVKDDYFIQDAPEKLLKCQPVYAESVLIMMARDELFPIGVQNTHDVRMTKDDDKRAKTSLINQFQRMFGKQFFGDVVNATEEWKKANVSRFPQTFHMVADVFFFTPMIKLADYISKWIDSVYLLSFEYVSQYPTGPAWQGVPHGWDLFYVFGVPLVGHEFHNYTERDANISIVTMTLISDFVKLGYLTTDGEEKLARYKSTTKSYNKLDLVQDKPRVSEETYFRGQRIDFWYKYLFQYDNFKCNENIEPNVCIYSHSSKVHYCVMFLILCVWTSVTSIN